MSQSNDQTAPDLPWRTRIAVSIGTTVTDFCRRDNGTINRRLLKLLELTIPATGKPETVHGKPGTTVTAKDITLDPAKNLWVRVFAPNGKPEGNAKSSFPVIIYFHGGGFTFGSPASRGFHHLCKRFSGEIPAVVVSVNYRLSPENRYPAPYEDGVEVMRWISGAGRKSSGDGALPENADVSRCFLAGDSAGANILHHVGYQTTKSADEFWPVKVAGHILLQPFFGGEERVPSELRITNAPIISINRTDWHWKFFLPENSNRDHHASNVFGPNSQEIGDLDFPASLVLIGGLDPLQDWQRRYIFMAIEMDNAS
ncbi:hypothetical protein AMTR_s00099p00101950 [Amborella trichopoda]|uniref:Alpha/beta hydrolase fold-3 domain-containing protein n=1 Tax=Amborella trichopoda TaxID=13333 RepID=W1NWN5_AMBTC|nr:hypothetical protein AMTR_s00099p00101950 [Amborella trichopoda]